MILDGYNKAMPFIHLPEKDGKCCVSTPSDIMQYSDPSQINQFVNKFFSGTLRPYLKNENISLSLKD